jgi:asparagine synthase (glutamine-hydrolysing)
VCGIVAILDPHEPVQPDTLGRAVRALEHRGPDGQGTWIDPDRRRIGLGHARLSVIDLEGGGQPLASEDGQVQVVVNGELYGFESLREQLQARGHVFRTRTDAEVLVHLYQEHGTGCLDHLRGEFAFALWDREQQLLFCARDRMGAKPLFYARRGPALLVASEVKALKAAGMEMRWDLEAVHDAIWLGVPAPARTLFQGVAQVPAGHFLTARGGQEVQLRRYWDLRYPEEGEAPRRDEAESLREVREALEEAVRLRLRADVPVAVYLSGGIDSAAVLAMAASQQRGPVQAFTLSFDRPRYDELALAEDSARRWGAALNAVPVTAEVLADHLGDAVWHAETFLKNAHGAARLALGAAVRRAGWKVVLTGEGADEVFGGYPPFHRDVLPAARSRLPLPGQDEIERGVLPAGAVKAGEPLSVPALEDLLGFVPSYFQDQAATARRYLAVCSDSFLSAWGARDAHRHLLEALEAAEQLRGRAPLSQSQYLWARTALPGYLLPVLGDRPEMASSVEGRLPFLDHRVVEAAARLPVDLRIRGGVEKYALREAVRPLVMDALSRRPKRLFLAPPAIGGVPDRLGELVQDTVRSGALDSVPFLDAAKVRRLVELLPSRPEQVRIACDPVVCTAVSACVLQERFRP